MDEYGCKPFRFRKAWSFSERNFVNTSIPSAHDTSGACAARYVQLCREKSQWKFQPSKDVAWLSRLREARPDNTGV